VVGLAALTGVLTVKPPALGAIPFLVAIMSTLVLGIRDRRRKAKSLARS